MGSSGGAAAAAISRIEQQIVAGAAVAFIDFLAIPQTYRQLLLMARLNGDGVNGQVWARFNGDAAGNYDTIVWTSLAAGAPIGVAVVADTELVIGQANGGGGSDPQSYGYAELIIPDYANAAMRKTTMCRGGRNDAPTATNAFTHGYGTWRGEVPITDIRVFLESGNIEAGSIATLYGLT